MPGTTLTLTVSFSDDTVAATSVTIPIVPTVTGTSPSGGEQGATVPVTVTGTKFQTGATLRACGPGVTVTGGGGAVPDAADGDARDRGGRAGGGAGRGGDEPGRGERDADGRVRGHGAGGAAPPPPPPPGVTLVWNGKAQDRVGPTEGQGAPDG